MPSAAQPPYSLDPDALVSEVRIDIFRASGPGGQHVNKTSSAVRLTHTPSGLCVIAQDSRSQFRNRMLAFARLIEKLRTLNHVPKTRIVTRPTRGSMQRRMDAKKNRSLVKLGRTRIEP